MESGGQTSLEMMGVWLVGVVGVVLMNGLRGGVDGDHVPVATC